MIKILFFIILFLIISSQEQQAQTGMKYKDFAKKLEQYFDVELINDLSKSLPQGSNFEIWGWDVGDYSGDGNNDVAFTLRFIGDKRKTVQVYLFIDMDGFLTLVSQIPYQFFELPLEIGVVIRNNSCFITKKNKQFDWEIRGYRFDNGTLILLDEFLTRRVDKYTHESYRNFKTLRGTEKYITTNNNETKLFSDFLILPSYPRGKQIYKGYSSEVKSTDIDYVFSGAYYWKGEKDCSIELKSAYDNENLYLTALISDDYYVAPSCDSCAADYLVFWFDMNTIEPNINRFVVKDGNKIGFRLKEDKNIYSIKISPGNFGEKKAFVKEVSSTDELETFQKTAIKKIKTIAALHNDFYTVKVKIPWLVFGFESCPIDNNKMTEFGFSAIYNDIDNEYRPDEISHLGISLFDSRNPTTYGSLILIPQDNWYGQSVNVYTEDILKTLIEYGF